MSSKDLDEFKKGILQYLEVEANKIKSKKLSNVFNVLTLEIVNILSLLMNIGKFEFNKPLFKPKKKISKFS